MPRALNRYGQLIEKIFLKHYRKGTTSVVFERAELVRVSEQLGITLPKNLGDVIYSFRYRTVLPDRVANKAPKGHEWMIRPAGRGRYQFVLAKEASFVPSSTLAKTKIPDATPGIVDRYSFEDEQALLAKIRYNRLIDIFTGVTCYSLQNHLRTTLPGLGQVETDEVYVGIDKRGIHYVFPVQAKGGNDRIGAVQAEQDFAVCKEKYPDAVGRPIAAQFMADGTIVLFEFTQTDEGVRVESEKHYRLVPSEELSAGELLEYRKRVS
jgi:hypothetical protein